jgi:hypothetical protein
MTAPSPQSYHILFSICAVAIRNTIISQLRQSGEVPIAHIRRMPYEFVYIFNSILSLTAFIFGVIIAPHSPCNQNHAEGDTDDSILNASRGIQELIPADQILVEIQTGSMPPLIVLPGKHYGIRWCKDNDC